MIELETIWQDYGLDKLEQGLSELFPQYELSLGTMLEKIMAGDMWGAMSYFFEGILSGVTGSFAGMKNILLWMVILGIVSALMTHFIEIFDKHQIADLGFYFIYLLLSAVLLQAFMGILQIASDTINNIVIFVKLLIPTFLLSVGLATGSVTVGASYQLLLFLIYGVESVLVGVVLPMVYVMCMLSVLNGIWPEEKLVLIVSLVEKSIGWILKAALGVVTGFSIVQAMVTPAVDAVKTSVLKKAVSAIPGVGNGVEGLMELVLGSAVVIKNSIGIALLILLVVLCAAPLLQMFATALLLKGAAALMGIVSGKRITACADRVGDACMLLFRTAGMAVLLFLISLSVVAMFTNRGI